VIASQNGLDQSGTSPLPESQLDRFLMRLSLGFPNRQAEAAMLGGQHAPLEELQTRLTPEDLQAAQQAVRTIHTSETLIGYVLDLVEASRRAGTGLSPRASQSLITAAKAWAHLGGRSMVTPDDVQAVFPAVAEHRLDGGHRRPIPISSALLEQVDGIR